MLADFTGFLNNLNPTGPSPDDGDTFVFEGDIVVWPMRRVEYLTLKLDRTLEIRFVPVLRSVIPQIYCMGTSTNVLLSCEAHVREQPFASRRRSVRTAYHPASTLMIPAGVSDVFVILNISSKVPFFLHMLKVLL